MVNHTCCGYQVSDFLSDLLEHFSLEKISKPLTLISVLLIFTVLTTLSLLILSMLNKLDSKTEYNVTTSSSIYTYTPSDQNSPKILLQNFKYIDSVCSGLGADVYQDGVITIYSGAILQIKKNKQDLVQLYAVNETSTNKVIGSISVDDGRTNNISNCFYAEMRLTKNNPTFSMILQGGVTVGEQVGDATNQYYSLVQDGQINILDKAAITNRTFAFNPIQISPGSIVYLKSSPESRVKGVIETNIEQLTINGVFNKTGGIIEVQKLFAPRHTVEPSGLERIINDSELAIGLSLGIFLSQIFGFALSTILRLGLFTGVNNEELRKND